MRMVKQRELTNLELALLGLINTGPNSGYDLCKIFESTPMGHFSSSPGAIYPALKRLESRGLLGSEVERAQVMRPRKVFSITPEGRDELASCVTRSVTREELVWEEDRLLLRFSFMSSVSNRRKILAFLGSVASETDALVAELGMHYKKMMDADPKCLSTGALAMGYGVESYRGLSRWAKQSIRTLSKKR